jgi:hypothetical protein
MFGMVIEKLYVQDLQKVSGHLERKICAVGVTNILTESPVMFQTFLYSVSSVKMRSECFVDIGGIYDHHKLSFHIL